MYLTTIDVLKKIQENCDKNNHCSVEQLTKTLNLSNIDLLPYLNELKQNEYISVYLGGDIKLLKKGLDVLMDCSISKHNKKRRKLFEILNSVVKWLFGIIAAVAAAAIIWFLGFN